MSSSNDNKEKDSSVLTFLKAMVQEQLFRDQFGVHVALEDKAKYDEALKQFIETVNHATDVQSLMAALREKFDPESLTELERMLERDLRKKSDGSGLA
jgi:hypothetical protein